MSIDIVVLSIVLLESFGIVSFLLALVFFRQSRKIGDKQESLKKATTADEVWNGPCYSYKWAMRHSMKQKKLLVATPFLAALAGLLGAVWFYGIGPHVFCAFIGLGYVPLIALIGAAILLSETNAFEAYRYGRAIRKVALDHLNREDQSYMELANEALEKAIARFLLIGTLFAVVGPFVPQIFEGLIYALVTYSRVIFQASESIFDSLAPFMPEKAHRSLVIAFAIAPTLAAILFLLPELIGRTIFRRVKLLAQRIWKRSRKR